MSEKLVLEALQKRLTTAVQSTLPTAGVKYAGMVYKPKANTPWIEVVHIPNNVIGEFWNTGKTYRGLFRILLHWPLDGQGIYPAMNFLQTLSNSFTKGTQLQNSPLVVSVTEHPDISTILEQETDNICVMSVRYNSFVA